MASHSTAPRSTDSLLRELLERTIRVETRLCVLMNFLNVKYDGAALVDPKTPGRTK